MKSSISRRSVLRAMGTAALSSSVIPANFALAEVPGTADGGWCPEGPDTPKICLDLPGARQDEAAMRLLKQIGVPRELFFEQHGLKITVHKFRNRIFIAAVNPAAHTVETFVQREGKFVLKDFWTGKKYYGGNHEIRLKIGRAHV